MILWLLHLLKGSYHIPAVFFYTSTRMLLSALTTLAVTIFLGPWFIRKLYELKIGQPIRSEECPVLGELHKEKKDTPTMGGLLILFAVEVAGLMWLDLSSAYSWILLASTLFLGVIGGVDDYLKLKYKNSRGMPSRVKFTLQMVVAAGVMGVAYFLWPDYLGVYFVPFFKHPALLLHGVWLAAGFLFSLIVITGASNAVNLSDGLDGLASGLILMVAVVLGLVAFASNHIEFAHYLNIMPIRGGSEIAVFLLGLSGACLGFLWYNGHPAQVFMGDVGSLTMGGLLGICAILLRRELLLALVGGVFVAEALSVILRVGSYKLRGGQRVFLCAPVHHHFEYKGWAETKVVIRFIIVGFLLAMIGLASLKFQ